MDPDGGRRPTSACFKQHWTQTEAEGRRRCLSISVHCIFPSIRNYFFIKNEIENSLEKKKGISSAKNESVFGEQSFSCIYGVYLAQLKLGEILKRVRLAIFEDIYEGWCFKSIFCTMSVVFCRFVVNF